MDHQLSLSDDVRTMAFTPDSRFLVSAGDYGIQVTDLEPEVWASGLCGTITRNLSVLEFQQYLGFNIGYHRTCANLP